MSDTYQAVYEAAVMRFDISCPIMLAQQAIANIELAWTSAHVVLRPKLFVDGDKWCALYGDNLMDGVAGFGESPYQAMIAFDVEWSKKLQGAKP